ncbi:signal transduction protein [Catenovulum agarivorans DS-2]|uniref:Signal transduction protein n=1 Tax=Catenovulum agarivorans DS-2 TaxID=1328313 RepID=W7QEE1_9ALTE|nr:GGDEF domain-containing phosphodiesterase [Catenovulum agarivorans]EWH10286.1 signal transduction protein [Catenovulum agarivorans DS-2]
MDITSIFTLSLPLFILLCAAQTFVAFTFRTFWHYACTAITAFSLLLVLAGLTGMVSALLLLPICAATLIWGCAQLALLARTFITCVNSTNESRVRNLNESATLQHLALHDSTTGLPNQQRLQQWRHHHTEGQHVLCVIKLTDVSQLNQTLGYQTTDLVLIQIAQRINKSLFAIDAVKPLENDKKLVSLGGVRFALIIDQGNSSHIVETVYQQIKKALPDPIPYESMMLSLSFEMGVSGQISDAKQIAECIQQAQTAIDYLSPGLEGYAAYTQDMDIFNKTQQKLLSDLSQAIKLQQLSLFSQPIINLENKQLIAAESLIRWRHPEFGLIEPERFIELAQRTGVIYSITQWVAKTSIQACSQWHQQGLEIDVSINLSSKDLLQHEFVDFLAQELDTHHLQASALIVEIREQALMQEPVISHSIIERLAAIGIKVVIDDFGTGFSSLSHLRALPLHGIKIDRQFIKLMNKGKKHQTLVNTMVDLSRNLHRKVFAEGIEDIEQEKVLKSMGCQYAQGFVYSRPIEIEGIASWAKQWQQQLES